MKNKKDVPILILGAFGQIGSEISVALAELYGAENVLLTDVADCPYFLNKYAFEKLDIRDYGALQKIVRSQKPKTIINLAALLSARGEVEPFLTWDINVNGFLNTIKVSLEEKVEKIMIPSSIAVFGPSSVLYSFGEKNFLDPQTMYGISKVSGEMLGAYFGRVNG